MAKRKEASELTNRGLATRVLQQVNSIRIALAIGEKKLDRLPKGIIGSPQMCVLARALSNGWYPSVGGVIVLSHPIEGIDWDGAKQALVSLGFERVRICRASSQYFHKPTKSLVFRTTAEMGALISRFDDGEFKHLLMED